MFTHVITTGVFKHPSPLTTNRQHDHRVPPVTFFNQEEPETIRAQDHPPIPTACLDERCVVNSQDDLDIKQRTPPACIGRPERFSKELIADKTVPRATKRKIPDAAQGKVSSRSSAKQCPCRTTVAKTHVTTDRQHLSRTCSPKFSSVLVLNNNGENLQQAIEMEGESRTVMIRHRRYGQQLHDTAIYGPGERGSSNEIQRGPGIDTNKTLETVCLNFPNKTQTAVKSPILVTTDDLVPPNRGIHQLETSFSGSPKQINLHEMTKPFGNRRKSYDDNNVKPAITQCKPSRIPVYLGKTTPNPRRYERISNDITNIEKASSSNTRSCYTQQESNTCSHENIARKGPTKIGKASPIVYSSDSAHQSLGGSSFFNDSLPIVVCTEIENTFMRLQANNNLLRNSTASLEGSIAMLQKSTAALKAMMDVTVHRPIVTNRPFDKLSEGNQLTCKSNNDGSARTGIERGNHLTCKSNNDGSARTGIEKGNHLTCKSNNDGSARTSVEEEEKRAAMYYQEDNKLISTLPKNRLCLPKTSKVDEKPSLVCECRHPKNQPTTNLKNIVRGPFVNGVTSDTAPSKGKLQKIRKHSKSACTLDVDFNEVHHDLESQPRRRSLHNIACRDAALNQWATFDGTAAEDKRENSETTHQQINIITQANSDESHQHEEQDPISQETTTAPWFNNEESPTINDGVDNNPTYIPLPYLPEEEVNRFKNIHLAQVLIPQIFGLALCWGCPDKLAVESFWEYLQRRKASSVLSADRLRTDFHISSDDIEKLKNNKHSTNLDVTLMVPLMQLCCEGLEDHRHPVWRRDDDTRTESLITKAKNQRNEICHGVRSAAVSGEVFEETKALLMTLIEVSGQHFGQSKHKIQKELELFVTKANALALKTEERRLIELQHLFHTQGLAESKAYWQEYCTTDAVPFTDNIVQRDKVFHPMEVFVMDVTANKCQRKKISYREILKNSDVNGTRTSIIRGEAGSGKTTVLKNISLQFLGIISNEIKFLNEIHLLLSMECRGRQGKTMKQFIENNFPKTCRKVTVDEALKCFSYIGNLIFIDGYDELNECSAQVVKEIVHEMKTSMPFCHIVFTTRPHAAIALESFLKNEGVPFQSYELVKISDEEDQLEFLRRYEQALASKANVMGMNEAFKELKEEVREFFVYPINLILFYYLFLHSCDAIKQWENSNDVIGQILLLYEMFIERKLNEHSIPNLKYLIRELLGEVNSFALECLARNKILLSDFQFHEIHVRCAFKLAAWGLLHVDANVVLSVVFLTKFSPTANSKPTYQFFHRSIQEMMGGRALAKMLREQNNNPTVHVLQMKLGLVNDSKMSSSNKKNKFSGFLNVLGFVVIELTQSDHGQCNLHLRPILAILEEECANLEFWTGLVLSCPTSPEVAEAGARAYTRTSWLICTPSEVVLASRLIRYLKLRLLRVSLSRSAGLSTALDYLMAGVGEKSEGLLFLELHGSYWNYLPFDESLLHLINARCGLSLFLGCLGSCKQSVKALAESVTRGKRVSLDISLTDPGQHHLMELEGTRSCLRVRVRLPLPGSVPTPRPLPRTRRGSPELTIECTFTTQPDEVLGLVVALAPSDGRFAGLQLQHWPQTNTFLLELLHSLAQTGVKTNGFGVTRWEPALTNTDGDCSVCNNKSHGPLERCVELWIL